MLEFTKHHKSDTFMFALNDGVLKVFKAPNKTFEIEVKNDISVAEFGRLVNRFLEMPNELWTITGQNVEYNGPE